MAFLKIADETYTATGTALVVGYFGTLGNFQYNGDALTATNHALPLILEPGDTFRSADADSIGVINNSPYN